MEPLEAEGSHQNGELGTDTVGDHLQSEAQEILPSPYLVLSSSKTKDNWEHTSTNTRASNEKETATIALSVRGKQDLDDAPEKKSDKKLSTNNDLTASVESVGGFVERVTHCVQPLPSATVTRTPHQGTSPGAYAEGPGSDRILMQVQPPPQGAAGATAPVTRTRNGSSVSLVQAREVPDEEQASGMVHAEQHDSGSVTNNTTKRQRDYYYGILTIVMICLVLAAALTLIGVFVAHGKESATSDEHSRREPTPSPSVPSPVSFLWNLLPEVTQQSISLEWVVAEHQANSATMSLTTTSHHDDDGVTPQTLAFQWLVQDPALWDYSSIRIYQRYALATLFYATQGKLWHEKANWLDYNTHECNWYVAREFRLGGPPVLADSPCGDGTANDTTGVFRRLWLPGNNLNGTFPSHEIYGMLTNLESINFFKTPELKGSAMTSEIGLLRNLSMISFSICAMSGTIPSELGLLSSSLQIMYFSKLKQWDPTTSSHNGYMTGTLPTELGLLTALKHLSLNNNYINGSLPTEMGELASLELFQFPGNNMTGSLPTELGLTRLIYLYGYDNSLTGVLPSELGLLSNTTHVHLYHNQLRSTIPTQLGALTSTKEFMLAGNSLGGEVPSELGSMSALRMLYLSHNPRLRGTFPAQLLNLSQLEALDLNDTSIQILEEGNIMSDLPTHIQGALNFSFWEYYYKCFRRFPCPV